MTFPRFSLRLYYDQGECIVLRTYMSDIDEVQEVVKRLTVVTDGCEVSVTSKSQCARLYIGGARVLTTWSLAASTTGLSAVAQGRSFGLSTKRIRV